MDYKALAKKYMGSCGSTCPFCGSTSLISHDLIETDMEVAYSDVVCEKCNKEWTDEYKIELTGVTFEEERETDDAVLRYMQHGACDDAEVLDN